jgi:uncharacterized protein (TIGR00255 family)
MIRSMTGYSRARGEGAGFALSVNIRSTNHRFLDTQVRVPSALDSLESIVRRLLKDHVKRGHVEVTVNFERTDAPELQLDRKLLAAYHAAFKALREDFGSAAEPDLVALLRIPGIVVGTDGELSPEELDRIQQILDQVTTEALERLDEMRGREGAVLGGDIRARLLRLQEVSDQIRDLSQRVPQIYQQRLKNRIRELLGAAELDESHLAQEVAYLASRSDITEELTRFRSHLEQSTHLLEESSEVGKKLDFLLQEMNREANTLLSKTTDVPEVGVEIARQAIELKTEIEKLREQAQNIE